MSLSPTPTPNSKKYYREHDLRMVLSANSQTTERNFFFKTFMHVTAEAFLLIFFTLCKQFRICTLMADLLWITDLIQTSYESHDVKLLN